MTIYGRFNKDKQTLEVMSDGAYASGRWEAIENAKTAGEAWRLFNEHKTGERLPRWASHVEWTGTY